MRAEPAVAGAPAAEPPPAGRVLARGGWGRLAPALVVLAVWACPATPALAQQLPSAGPPSAAALAAAEEAAAAPAPIIARPLAPPLREIRFLGGPLLPEVERDALRRRFAGRPTTQATAQALAADASAAYASRGHALARAEVAGVDPRAGRIALRLVEPHLGAVQSDLPGTLGPAYLAWRLGLASGAPIDTTGLTPALTALSLDDDLRLDAEFRPGGSAPDALDLHLGFPGLAPRGGSLTLDNDGKPSTGRLRLGLAYGWRGLSGWGDPLALSLTLSRLSGSAALSYSRPVTRNGTRLTLAVDAAASRTRAAPVVTNRTAGAEVGLLLPLWRTDSARASITAALLGFRERGRIAGAPLVDQRGSGARLGMELRRSGPGWFLATGGSLLGLSWSDRIAGDGSLAYRSLGLNLAGARQISPGLVLAGQAAAQLSAGSRAPARHRFGVAGRGGVRGYGTDAPGADSGFWLRLQLEAAEPLGRGQLRARPYLFVDTGRGRDRIPGGHVAGPQRAALGLGASVLVGRRAVAEGHIARQLVRDRALPGVRGAELRLAVGLQL